MDLLVPPYEVRDPFLDADLGPVVELTLRPPQVGGRQPDVPRLVGVPLDPHATPQGPSDQLDQPVQPHARAAADVERFGPSARARTSGPRSEEHTSELQSRSDLVCRLLLEKKKQTTHGRNPPEKSHAPCPDSKCRTSPPPPSSIRQRSGAGRSQTRAARMRRARP